MLTKQSNAGSNTTTTTPPATQRLCSVSPASDADDIIEQAGPGNRTINSRQRLVHKAADSSGNAAFNTISDLLLVLDEAIAQLRVEIADGHHRGDPATSVNRSVQVRSDSAGVHGGFMRDCRTRNVGFAVVPARTQVSQ